MSELAATAVRTDSPRRADESQPPLPSAGTRVLALRLIGISAVCLFLEMALIRFINSTVQVIAYFNNFVILATFLGMGFGALFARRWPRLLAHAPVVLSAFITALVAFERFASATEDQRDLVAWVEERSDLVLLPSAVVVSLVFAACFAVFVTLGCELGRCIEAFRDRLQAYGYDLLGSLTGVVAFALVSFCRSPPWVWFLITGAGIGLLSWAAGIRLTWRLPLMLAAAGATLLVSNGQYSPYYKVHLVSNREPGRAKPTHYSVFVDKLRIQDAIDFDQDLSQTRIGAWVPYYQLPYRIKPAPDRVLVLGGGSGNDTVIALKAGAKHVDVVEIDPVLVDFGHTVHPQRPYADARVHTVNDDARAFLRRSTGDYDLIVMNALDSHHQLPGLSTLRLESYIYTVQAFQDVRRHLRPDSVFVVHLSSTRKWMGERLYWSLTEAFGRKPALFTTPDSPFQSLAFVYGPASVLTAARQVERGLVAGMPQQFEAVEATTTLATDDWPHLYLAGPTIPQLYFKVLTFIVLLTLICFLALSRMPRRGESLSAQDTKLLHFALLGASFMLLETRAITQFALLFGSTWFVSAIVIASILLVIFAGNRWLQRRGGVTATVKRAIYTGLLASLFVLYFLPIDAILPFNLGLRIGAAAIVIGVPLFCASLLFSDSFRRAPDGAAAFGANLVGVVLGGALEYSSMQFGLRALYLGAAALYSLAWLAEHFDIGVTRSESKRAVEPAL
jgi:SAM-dependent methyltransferase